MISTYINRIACAVPGNEVHRSFINFAEDMLLDRKARAVFLRMARMAGISQRFSTLKVDGPAGADGINAYDFYRRTSFPSTGARMELFERFAPVLMRAALDKLALTAAERGGIRHVLVTSCTGFYAPGLDFDAVDHLGLSTTVERTMIGFMGCYAALNALKLARHIVRSQPQDKVLIINLELCTLHFQETQNLGELLSFLIFGDGCSASLVSSEPVGFEMEGFSALQIPGTRDLITWNVRDLGFDMLLSGRVPGEVGRTLRERRDAVTGGGEIDLWAVHPGGRTVLDAVEEGLSLRAEDLAASRGVLDRFGNMSSATVMFVLEELINSASPGQRGCAMSFGPGLTAETMRFRAV